MNQIMRLACLLLIVALSSGPGICAAQDSDGFRRIFDGKSLDGWRGDTKLWSVVDGAIVAETTPDKKIKSNNFLVWDHGNVDDFVLKFKFRISGTDRAIVVSSFEALRKKTGPWLVTKPTLIAAAPTLELFMTNVDEVSFQNGAKKTTISVDGKKNAEKVNDPGELMSKVKKDDWNDYEIKAVGNELMTKINGHVMTQLLDEQTKGFDRQGLLGLQLHVGPPMKIEFKDLMLKRLPLANDQKKVVFVAGKKSHGWGSHEHYAGCRLLANRLDVLSETGKLPVLTTVYKSGWPADPTALITPTQSLPIVMEAVATIYTNTQNCLTTLCGVALDWFVFTMASRYPKVPLGKSSCNGLVVTSKRTGLLTPIGWPISKRSPNIRLPMESSHFRFVMNGITTCVFLPK